MALCVLELVKGYALKSSGRKNYIRPKNETVKSQD